MSIYFVDFENVNSMGLTGISKQNLDESDKLIIFYSENAKSITFDLHKELEKIKTSKEYIKVKVGSKNALDFQLATYLGSLVEKDKSKRYYIISKDLSFDAVCDFWKSRNAIVKRIDSISSIDRIKDDIIKALDGVLSEKKAIKVYNIITNYKTKQGIYNNLVKTFPSNDNAKALDIYKRIEPHIKDKKD